LSAEEERIRALVSNDIEPLRNEFDDNAKSSDKESVDSTPSPQPSTKTKRRQPRPSEDFYELGEKRLKVEERKAHDRHWF
jgi:hypothetical protein